ncbi:MAG: RNB domain-containing ribonuclease [Chloracidobacterium sp.]|nr:RNB domain-containing ribonuclease [Chloracidobacterium sp.]MCO5332732.1 RNB domain-containing ribonuclease [Pyrinomonadaceae bacterium]
MNDSGHKNWLGERAYETVTRNGFEPDFSAAVAAQLKEIVARRDPEPAPNITDLRDTLWSSIDNKTSKDLDQIEWAEQLENGDIRLLVGIADVAAFVEKDTPIDRHAKQNTVTVYTETRIFPMLPEELSTDITSLVEGEDRLAVVADMIVKENGDVPDTKFFRALVRNHAKLDYESVGEWLEGRGQIPQKIADTVGLEAQIRLQNAAAVRLGEYRARKGALDFESIESSAVVEDGEVREIRAVEPNAARKLIENFMIATNVEMAEFLERENVASLRRVVEAPERWDGIVRIAAEYGEQLPSEPDLPAFSAFLARRKQADPERFPDLSLSLIKLIGAGRCVVQRPGEDAGGHFGLAVNDYAHSTAPNRRFTDIVVQRIVKAVIAGEQQPYTPEELDDIAEQANLQAKAARKVERRMRKIVAAAVLQHHIGQEYDAIVTGDTKAGIFARILRPPVDGMVVRGQKRLDVGDKVRVKLLSANPQNGFIDFAVER